MARLKAFRRRLANFIAGPQAAPAPPPLLADALGDVVLRHDIDGNVLSVSGRVIDAFGLSPEKLVGGGLFERIHVQDRPAYLQAVNAAARGKQSYSAVFRLRAFEAAPGADLAAEQSFAWAEMRVIRFASGLSRRVGDRTAALISILRDVTAAKTMEARLQASRAEAELANSWKDRLLANVSHELRTPLNAIIGFAEILSDAELAPREPVKQREYAGIINASAAHLLSVVNLILDMSKIEAGEFALEPEAFDLGALIASCCDMLRLKAAAGGVGLDVAAPDEPLEIFADKRACRQILLNVIANAVKFTPTGGRVAISLNAEGELAMIEIRDTGVGIPEESLPRLGEAFFQVRSSYDRMFEGTGLGLSLVRGLVGLHGGALRVESLAGQGTCVTVQLPLKLVIPARAAAPPHIETFARLRPAPPDQDAGVIEERLSA